MNKSLANVLAGATLALAAWHASAAEPAQAQAQANDTVAVGPYRMNVAVQGDGPYTVLFESGFGMDLRAWRKVAPAIAESARVVTYSRAGYGKSDPRPEPRTPAQSSAELDELVRAAGLRPPFILVGHSYGGLLIRAFAARHPEQVAGMVFVDPADEGFAAALKRLDAQRAAQDDQLMEQLTPAPLLPELKAVQAALDSGRPVAGALPDVPAVVLTSMRSYAQPEFFLQTPAAQALWRDAHAGLTRQFTGGSQIVTTNSGHIIQMDEPELVIGAIRQVIRETGKRRQLAAE